MTNEKGRGRPALDDVDLSDMPGQIRQPNSDEVERRRAFASTLETPAFVEHSTSVGAVKVMRSRGHGASSDSDARQFKSSIGTPPAQPNGRVSTQEGTRSEQERRPRAEEPNLTVRLPVYVQQAVRMRAVSEHTTLRLIILRALRGAGFEIHDDDMTDDRGIVAKMRTRGRLE